MFFSKKDSSNYTEKLMPKYQELVDVISEIDGSIDDLYEVGIFVGSIAIIAILHKETEDAEIKSDKFNIEWLDAIRKIQREKGKEIDTDLIIKKLQERYPVYRDMFLDFLKRVENEGKDNKSSDDAVQFTWELFSNATKKQKPEQFINLVMAVPFVMSITADIYDSINRPR